MKIKAITQDQLIVIDGVAVEAFEEGGYVMRNGEWAVSYDTFMERGEIEYIDSRQNEEIGKEVFERKYRWLVELHHKIVTKIEQEDK